MNAKEVEAIEAQIEELKKRWPRHSAPPVLWEQMEDLEDQLREAKAQDEDGDDGAAGAG